MELRFIKFTQMKVKLFCILIISFHSIVSLCQINKLDSIGLHGNFFQPYSPDSLNAQPKEIYTDSNNLFRWNETGALFKGVIIEEFSRHHHPQRTIDTLFYYFDQGLFIG